MQTPLKKGFVRRWVMHRVDEWKSRERFVNLT